MKYLFIALLIFAAYTSYCQLPSGLGPFKIDQTTISIIDSLKNSSVAIEEIPYSGDPESKDYYKSPKIKDRKSFSVYGMNIANMRFGNITLDFWKDTLYSIDILQTPIDFYETMKLKYGNPITKTSKKKITCTSKLVGDYDLEEVTYVSTFRDGKILIQTMIGTYYNDDCEKKYLDTFLAIDQKKSDYINKLENKQEDTNKANSEKAKKEKLKDL